MSTGQVWLFYRAHKTIPRQVEMLCILSAEVDIEPALMHPLIREYQWERVGDNNYHAYDSTWEYKLERWEIDDSEMRTNWIKTSTGVSA